MGCRTRCEERNGNGEGANLQLSDAREVETCSRSAAAKLDLGFPDIQPNDHDVFCCSASVYQSHFLLLLGARPLSQVGLVSQRTVFP